MSLHEKRVIITQKELYSMLKLLREAQPYVEAYQSNNLISTKIDSCVSEMREIVKNPGNFVAVQYLEDKVRYIVQADGQEKQLIAIDNAVKVLGHAYFYTAVSNEGEIHDTESLDKFRTVLKEPKEANK